MGNFVQKVGITADASQFNQEIKKIDSWLESFKKKELEIGIDTSSVENAAEKAFMLLEGKFQHLNLELPELKDDKVTKKMAKDILELAHGLEILDQAVKPGDILKLGGASTDELKTLIKEIVNLPGTKPTGRPIQKRLEALYEKYPNGAPDNGFGGKGGGGFGVSDEALNKIGNTLERIDVNVKSINDSIQTGAVTVVAAAEGTEKLADSTKKAADSTKEAVRQERELGAEIDKNKKKKESNKTAPKTKKGAQPPASETKSESETAQETKTESVTVPVEVPNTTEIKTATNELNQLNEAAAQAKTAQDNLAESAQHLGEAIGSIAPAVQKQKASFKDITDVLSIPKDLKKYFKDPTDIDKVLKGLDNSKKLSVKTFDDWEPERFREIESYLQEIKAFNPDNWREVLSNYSKLESLFTNEVVEDVEGAFSVNGEDYYVLLDRIEEYVNKYNSVKAMLERGMSKEDVRSRLDLMNGFSDEEVKNVNLGTNGTVKLYQNKIEQTQQRLQQIKELKQLIEQEVAEGKEITEIEQIFLNTYQDTTYKGNKIISDAKNYKTALENPESVRQANKERMEAANERPEIEFSEKTKEAAKSQNELAESVREANKALIEQEQEANNAGKALMYHIGKLSNEKAVLTHPFGSEMRAQEGVKTDGRIWGAGTGLYLSKNIEEIKSAKLDNDNKTFYAIDTSNLKMYTPKSEEAAADFFNFLHNIEQLCLTMGAGITAFDDTIGNINEDTLFTDFQRIFPNIKLSFDQFIDFIDNMTELTADSGIPGSSNADPYRLKAFKENFGVDDIKTRFMKMLGYQGIDFSKSETYGGTLTGNVLFDALDKKRIVASGNDLDEVVKNASKTIEETQQAAVEAQKNADEATRAVEQAQDAVEKSEQLKTGAITTAESTEKSSPALDAAKEQAKVAEQDSEQKVAYVKYSMQKLVDDLRKKTSEISQLKAQKSQLEQQITTINSPGFDVSKPINNQNSTTWAEAIEQSGMTKDAYLEAYTKNETNKLTKIQENLSKKQKTVDVINKYINDLDVKKAEGYKVLVKDTGEDAFAKGKGKTESIAPTVDEKITDIKETGNKARELKDAAQKAGKEVKEADSITDYLTQEFENLEKKDKKTKGTARVRKDKPLPGSGSGSGTGSKPYGTANGSVSTPPRLERNVAVTEEDVNNANALNEAIKKLNANNTKVPEKAKAATQAINDETNALKNMAKALSDVEHVSEQLDKVSEDVENVTKKSQDLTTKQKQPEFSVPNKPQQGYQATATTTKQEVKKNDEAIALLKAQIKSIEDARNEAERDLSNYEVVPEKFDIVGKNKTKAFKQVQDYAKQLEEDYKAFEKLDQNDKSEKAKEVIAKYENSRVAFAKAYEKAKFVGVPKRENVEKKMASFADLYEKQGFGSEGYDEIKKRTADNYKMLQENFNQQKQEADKILQELYAKQKSIQPDTSAKNTGKNIEEEGNKAKNAVNNFDELTKAKESFVQANKEAANSAQNTGKAIDEEGNAANKNKDSFDTKPYDERIKTLEETVKKEKQLIADLQKERDKASQEEKDRLQRENEVYKQREAEELQQRREAALTAATMTALQQKEFEEQEKIREQQAQEAAKKAQTKADDKDLAKIYSTYGKDFDAVLNANSVQQFDVAVAHLTETERIFQETRLKNLGESNVDIYKQNLPKDYKKSTEAQIAGLKERQTAIADFTAKMIAEAEKQQEAFDKMDTLYKVDSEHPANGRASFIQNSKVDEAQTRSYVVAVDNVTESLSRFKEMTESMRTGNFDFGDVNALREFIELREKLGSQMSTLKTEDKGFKSAQGELEAEAQKVAAKYGKALSSIADQIEKVQDKSRKLINPDNEYVRELKASEVLLNIIKELIEEINNNPLQFMDKNAVSGMKVFTKNLKEDVKGFEEDYNSQQGIQGRIGGFLSSYKGVYTSMFREIRDSFKSQATGELKSEVDRTFKTFGETIRNLDRATGLGQGDILYRYLDSKGGKATATQIEQQQKVRNAIEENYRGLITDISDEMAKVQDRLTNVLGENLSGNKYMENFTAGLGDEESFAKFQNNAEKAIRAYEQLQDIQKPMSEGKINLLKMNEEDLQAQIKTIIDLFGDLNTAYKEVQEGAKEFSFADKGDIERQRASISQFLKSNVGIDPDAKAELNQYFNMLKEGISQADLEGLTTKWRQVADAEQAAGRTGTTFFSELQTRFKNLGAYLLSFVSFYRVIGIFKDGIGIIKELDSALTEMNKVSDESLNTLQKYQKETFDTAGKIGTTAVQLQKSTADFMRLGQSLQKASESAQTANILLNVSEFTNIEDATTALIAMTAAYEDAANGIGGQEIVDRLNLVGNNYAISTDQLATALQDSASALTTSGNSLDEAISLLTAGNAVVQNATVVGRFLPKDNYIG